MKVTQLSIITRRHLLRGALGYLGFTLTGCASQSKPLLEPGQLLPPEPEIKAQEGRGYVIEGCVFDTSELIVTPGHKHSRTFKSQGGGERDLEILVNDPDVNLEEQWIFMQTSQGEEVWWDIGKMQTDTSVAPDSSFVGSLLVVTRQIARDRGVEVIFTDYHIHPLSAVSGSYIRRTNYEQLEQLKLLQGIPRKVLNHSHQEILSVPSAGDIRSQMVYQTLRKEGFIFRPSRVMSPSGLFTYEAQSPLKRMWEEKGLDYLEALDNKAKEAGFRTAQLSDALNVYRTAGLEVEYERRRILKPAFAFL